MANIQIHPRYLTNLTKNEQITELNTTVKCKLGVSKIDGIGVIAIKNIRKGEKCFISPRFEPRFYNIPFGSFSHLMPEVRELILQRWASVANGSLFMSPSDDAKLLMFVNHSFEPNYDVVTDTALRDIKSGEEVFEDYTLMENWQKVRPLDKNPWLDCSKNDTIKEKKPWYEFIKHIIQKRN